MAEEINTSWDLIPPERHFNNIGELISSFNLYFTTGLEDWELNSEFVPPVDKFEAVRHHSAKGDKKYLWPTSLTYSHLFRGQGEFHKQCVPTLYRNECITEEDLFLNRIRLEEFRMMLMQFPQVRYFIQKGYTVDFKGLAQHYGIPTDVLDLTSSIEVALFFAMCDYDKHTKKYKAKDNDNTEYIGYLYAYPYLFHLLPNSDPKIKELNLLPIGLQPFRRPGAQRGFALHIDKGVSFRAPIYSFSYTAEDSRRMLAKMSHIYCDDEIAAMTSEMNESKDLFIDSVRTVCNKYSKIIFGKQISHRKALNLLQNLGYKITRNPSWKFGKDYLASLNTNLPEKLAHYEEQIVRRMVIDGKIESPCMDLGEICQHECLQAFKKGCRSLQGYNSGIDLCDNGQYVSIGVNSGRPQTEPNPQTGKIDKWDYLPWKQYEAPSGSNRFKGDFPRMQRVFVPKDKNDVQL